MTEKRFTAHIVWFNYEKTEGEITLKDNGQPLLISNSVEDVRYIKDLLNELHEQNQQLKHQLDYIQNSITNAIPHQKTELEQKALKKIIQDYNKWLLGE